MIQSLSWNSLFKKYFLKKFDFNEILNLLTPIKYGEYYVDMGCAGSLCQWHVWISTGFIHT